MNTEKLQAMFEIDSQPCALRLGGLGQRGRVIQGDVSIGQLQAPQEFEIVPASPPGDIGPVPRAAQTVESRIELRPELFVAQSLTEVA
jgi:hypothetical protein